MLSGDQIGIGTVGTRNTWAFRIIYLQFDRFHQLIKFCVVGSVGFLMDMIVLYLLADPATLALGVTFSKICAAGTAMSSNFIWNERWTFNLTQNSQDRHRGLLLR